MIETCQTNPNCEIKPSNCEYAVRCTTCEDLANNKEVYACWLNDCKEIMGDKTMGKSKIVETVQMLEQENKLLKKQNKEFEDSIGELARDVKRYEDALSTLRTRCTDSARDMFDKKMYGCLSVVRGRKELDCRLNFDSPLDFAKSLIEHRTHIEERAIENAKGAVFVLVPEHDKVTFDYDELEEIAEYLLTYCKHNKEVL